MAGGGVVRAVIFDVYHTLLRVEPGPADAAERWENLCREMVLPGMPGTDPAELAKHCAAEACGDAPTLHAFQEACRREIVQDHILKKRAGIRCPEVDWRDVTRRAWPALAVLPEDALDGFLADHAALERACLVMPGAVEFLTAASQSGALLGIASNAQNYTLHELRVAGLDLEPLGFEDSLCFWSWREGFSKPDPGVFRLLTDRLAERGMSPEEILMIGDRLDNDILPAQAAGWRTWHFAGAWPWQAAGR